ncbi:MAG: FRG domain-containing protein [Nitrospirae bacterium]|nr:FRG domain-containing protein [Nitrospirota bacterium]
MPAEDELLLYRGHSDRKAFMLLPSVLRDDKFRNAEETILRELVASHPAEFMGDATTLDQLVRVQHYSLPTRLLDVTWNPLVALYFASNDKDGISGEVIVFRVKRSSVKFFDSDSVSCVANLAHLKNSEKEDINFDLPNDIFNTQHQVDRLLHFIRVEKPHFSPVIRPSTLKTVLCVKPKKSNRRILAQSGAFLLFGMTESLDEMPVDGIAVERIQINGKKKKKIVWELDRMGFNEASMFPEIEKAAAYIKDKL